VNDLGTVNVVPFHLHRIGLAAAAVGLAGVGFLAHRAPLDFFDKAARGIDLEGNKENVENNVSNNNAGGSSGVENSNHPKDEPDQVDNNDNGEHRDVELDGGDNLKDVKEGLEHLNDDHDSQGSEASVDRIVQRITKTIVNTGLVRNPIDRGGPGRERVPSGPQKGGSGDREDEVNHCNDKPNEAHDNHGTAKIAAAAAAFASLLLI